jgi:hypothetical protein
MEGEGRIISKDYNKYSGGQVVFRPRNMSPSELQGGYWKLYEELFTLNNVRKRAAHNMANLGPLMRIFIMGVNFHYRGHIRRKITPGIV